ncbi:Der GTPase-activating protein YihI [Glaciecola siphonariae]|uniref:Der GTPase-activating protein YihI n=1 Tax=Glaciecola siphonariae TaxID=521012 RepID=A0ABV9LQN1_9ALTE
MARVKKSRKIGKIGITKTEAPKKPKKPQLGKSTNNLGNKAGSRQHIGETKSSQNSGKGTQDPRHGSKKSVDLNKYLKGGSSKAEKSVKKFSTPQQELDAIEQDPRLEKLLAKQETKTLTKLEQVYVNETLARHKVLCEMLGIDIDDEESEQETDPFAKLDAIRLDDFKD